MNWIAQKNIYAHITNDSMGLTLVSGLIGIPELTKFNVTFKQDEFPFVRINSLEEKQIAFLAADPFYLIKGYETIIADDEASSLDISRPDDAIILAIATFAKDPCKITLNLMAPLFINCNTGAGKQVVLENYKKFSPRHVIYEGENVCLS